MNNVKRYLLTFLSYKQAENLKTYLYFALYYSGLAYLISLFIKKGATVLVYHSVGGKNIFNDNIVSLENFERQISYLTKKYNIVPISSLEKKLESREDVPGDWVILTFDDGYADNFHNVFPILKRYGVKAVFYITTAVVQNNMIFFYDKIQTIINNTKMEKIIVNLDNRTLRFRLTNKNDRDEAVLRMVLAIRGKYSSEREKFIEELGEICGYNPLKEKKENTYIKANEIKKLIISGMEIGSHTISHPNMAGLSEEELIEEILVSKKTLEHLCGVRITSFSYPFGKKYNYNESIKNMVKHAGYKSAVTTVFGKIYSNSASYELSRIGVRNTFLTRLKVNLMGISF